MQTLESCKFAFLRFILGNVEVWSLCKLFLNVEIPKHMDISPRLTKKPKKNIHYFDCLMGDMLLSVIFSIVP